MSITQLFETLNVPLANPRWSWGGVDEERQRVFLRAWQDQTQRRDSKRFIRLAHHEAYAGETDNPGYNERLRHLKLLSSGYLGFVVMCRAQDALAIPRAISGFDARDVFRLGELINVEGDEWAELVERVPVRSL